MTPSFLWDRGLAHPVMEALAEIEKSGIIARRIRTRARDREVGSTVSPAWVAARVLSFSRHVTTLFLGG